VLSIFKKLGINESKGALFTPTLVNYIENKGGKAMGGIFVWCFEKIILKLCSMQIIEIK